MADPGFELAIKNAFNVYFEEEGHKAIAYKRYSPKRINQEFDVLVDSKRSDFYLAVECKSVLAAKSNVLYFSSTFHGTGEGCQIEREAAFIRSSGRYGLLAVERRGAKGESKRAYLMPWATVERTYIAGHKGIPCEVVTDSLQLPRSKGKYIIDDEIIRGIGAFIDRPKKQFKNPT